MSNFLRFFVGVWEVAWEGESCGIDCGVDGLEDTEELETDWEVNGQKVDMKNLKSFKYFITHFPCVISTPSTVIASFSVLFPTVAGSGFFPSSNITDSSITNANQTLMLHTE